jgi:alcohol dehydrogenase class IV
MGPLVEPLSDLSERFFNPTDIRWCDWRRVCDLLPAPPIKVSIATTDSSLARAEELRDDVLRAYQVQIHPLVAPDPTTESVQAFVDDVLSASPDWIIAIGGGSVLDTAKAAALVASNGEKVSDHVNGAQQITQPGIPLIAVPTTSGSGSEVTPYASITDTKESRKISLSHDYLFPRFAVLDPSLTLSLPPRQTAISGMDALSHAIEGYWSNRATPATDALALSAARLMMDQLPKAKSSPGDLVSRQLAMEGSMLAGMTISNARTTAVHAISYPITVFYGVPHGLACSLLLPSMIRFNSGGMTADKEQRLLDVLNVESMGQIAESVERLQIQLELPNRLGEVGIGKGEIGKIVENGYRPDRMANNPKVISAGQLTEMLENIV